MKTYNALNILGRSWVYTDFIRGSSRWLTHVFFFTPWPIPAKDITYFITHLRDAYNLSRIDS